MENTYHPDPSSAAIHIHAAVAELKRATIALGRVRGSEDLWELAERLDQMAGLFRDGKLNAGLKVSLVTIRSGARVMGQTASPKKLEALAKARLVLAAKRRLAPPALFRPRFRRK
jgi:hypothetical protein